MGGSGDNSIQFSVLSIQFSFNVKKVCVTSYLRCNDKIVKT